MKCRSCGLDHPGHWNCARAKFEANKVANKPEVVIANSTNVVVNDEPGAFTSFEMVVYENSKHGRYADPEKRKQYMRDYMRNRRKEKP